jgi:hypothetical protein
MNAFKTINMYISELIRTLSYSLPTTRVNLRYLLTKNVYHLESTTHVR